MGVSLVGGEAKSWGEPAGKSGVKPARNSAVVDERRELAIRNMETKKGQGCHNLKLFLGNLKNNTSPISKTYSRIAPPHKGFQNIVFLQQAFLMLQGERRQSVSRQGSTGQTTPSAKTFRELDTAPSVIFCPWKKPI